MMVSDQPAQKSNSIDSAEFQELNQIVDHWLRWHRLRQAVCWAGRGLAGGALLGLLAGLIAVPQGLLLRLEYIRMGAALTTGGLVLAALLAGAWPVKRLKATRAFDRSLELSERVSTALELDVSRRMDGVSRLQLADALHSARSVKIHKRLPIRLSYPEIGLALALIAGLWIFGWWSQAYFSRAEQRRAFQSTITAQAEQLEKLKEEIEQDPSLSMTERQTISRPLDEAIQRLNEARSREQALSALREAEIELKELDSPDLNQQIEAMRAAGNQLAAEAGNQTGNPLADFEAALQSSDLAAAIQALNGLDPAEMSAEERQKLTEQLEKASQALAQADPVLSSQLQSAANALRQGDGTRQQVAQALQSAAQTLQGRAGRQAQATAAGRAAAQVAASQSQVVQTGGTPQTFAPGAGQGTSQAGQGAGLSAGNGAGNAGNNPGSGAGNSTAAGGNGNAGAGRGPGGGDAGTGPEAGQDPIGQDNGPGDGGLRSYDPVYAPQNLGGEGQAGLDLPGSGDPGDLILGQSPNIPGAPGQSVVPYINVLPAYMDAYRQALETGQIPAHLRGLIRSYFSSLQP